MESAPLSRRSAGSVAVGAGAGLVCAMMGSSHISAESNSLFGPGSNSLGDVGEMEAGTRLLVVARLYAESHREWSARRIFEKAY